ncbi:hypothetical protein CL689_02780 [Candidatus Saccharibacteria bacterium]|nr:hypothetical protein [Candidatus Saccharibacteria bacterium]|tara:strand:- start:2091 stop:2408 length:318 start_codon:yes stop_codon:yes gene_type:complete
MKSERNVIKNVNNKYAVINLRKVDGNPQTPQELLEAISKNPESVEFGLESSQDEFWLIKLRDKYAAVALQAYADAARADDPEYADMVDQKVKRAGPNSAFCKAPD